jgi:hypothetical protein
MRSYLTWAIALWFVEAMAAQPALAPKATLRWLQPTLDLGQTIEAELTIVAPAQYRFFLVDTVLAFAPFDLIGIGQRDSTSEGGQLRRIARFRLRSFSVEESQSLRLVLFYKTRNDTARTLTVISDTIGFHPRIMGNLDQQLFIYNPQFIPVPEPVDLARYWWLMTAGVVGLAMLVAVLRRPLRRWWQRRHLARYARGLRRELEAVRGLTSNSAAFIQQLNRVWKEDLQHTWPHDQFRWKSCTSDELPVALRRYSSLSDDEINLLTQLCQKEDRLFYARAKAEEGELLRLWHHVDNYLRGELRRRRKSIS